MTGPLLGEPTSDESTITITIIHTPTHTPHTLTPAPHPHPTHPYTHKEPVMWKAVPCRDDIMTRLLCNIIWYWTKIEIEQDTFSTASFLRIHLLILMISISSWWYIRSNILQWQRLEKDIHRSDVKVTFQLYCHFRCLQVPFFQIKLRLLNTVLPSGVQSSLGPWEIWMRINMSDFKLILMIDCWSMAEIALIWMSLRQCRPRSMSPYGVTWP